MRMLQTFLAAILATLLLQTPAVWNNLGKGPISQSGLVVSGMIAFIDTGSCPAGWTEETNAGQYVLITQVANGDAGTTGGSTSYTPAGSNATVSFTPAGTNGTAAFK